MADTKIEYVHKVWNPVTGCTKVSPGCLHCYAERMAKRLAGRYGYPAGNGFAVTLHPERLQEPLNWAKPKRIFPCSMGDLFHEDVPDDFVCRVYEAMGDADYHRYLVLTKRVNRMCRFYDAHPEFSLMAHIWPGVTVCNQDELWKVKELQDIPAAGYWVSVEPMLGHVNLVPYLSGLDWVVAGCETGPGARFAMPHWFANLREQCRGANVPYFLKAVDAKRNHLLDGVAHREIPDTLKVGGEG